MVSTLLSIYHEGMALHQVEVRTVDDGTAQTNITCLIFQRVDIFIEIP